MNKEFINYEQSTRGLVTIITSSNKLTINNVILK